MTARLRRIASDWEQVKKDFAGHRYIVVTPVGAEPPEKYNVTYFVNGIYLLPDGRIQTLGRHEAEILLHLEYPRLKPVCKIKTPIWHPNFKDGLICIGDIWGAGESLSDIIINIGDMIQYKSWNSYSPLSFEAAHWAMENKHIFPVGTLDLYAGDRPPKE
ncbi:MAG: ubiquitin--protein ligase, partial [Clostridiales bacterium]|nr:ubiquitin--protein ligase [Clostridiales bacterium]